MTQLDTITVEFHETSDGFLWASATSTRTGETYYAAGRSYDVIAVASQCATTGGDADYDGERISLTHESAAAACDAARHLSIAATVDRVARIMGDDHDDHDTATVAYAALDLTACGETTTTADEIADYTGQDVAVIAEAIDTLSKGGRGYARILRMADDGTVFLIAR